MLKWLSFASKDIAANVLVDHSKHQPLFRRAIIDPLSKISKNLIGTKDRKFANNEAAIWFYPRLKFYLFIWFKKG